MKKKVLVVDIGGTNVKLLMSLRDQRKFSSGPGMTPRDFVAKLKETVRGWNFGAISIGFPSPVRKGRIVRDPKHLGQGWAGFDFRKALGKPAHVINDAAMQALGSYRGASACFFSGSAPASARPWYGKKLCFRWSSATCPIASGDIIEEWLGQPGLERLGQKKWMREVEYAIVAIEEIVHCRLRRFRRRQRPFFRAFASRF